MAKYGEALVCVRYWYDPKNDTELKTAEVVALRRQVPSLRFSRGELFEVKRRRKN